MKLTTVYKPHILIASGRRTPHKIQGHTTRGYEKQAFWLSRGRGSPWFLLEDVARENSMELAGK